MMIFQGMTCPLDFAQTAKDTDEDISILEEDNSQIYAHLDNVLVHMIDNQEAAIFKSKQDFNKNKEKILQYIKYTEKLTSRVSHMFLCSNGM